MAAPVALRLQRSLPDTYVDASPEELASRIAAAKETLGERLFVLGHHYQRDEVMRWADARGDSFRLSVQAQEHPEADYIVFCGVHFMAESADILTGEHQQVILPDLNAGCSMADMADIDEVTEAWESLAEVTDVSRLVPITYMNSSAALKAFVGEHGGAVCTSTNAREILEWAFTQGDKVLFFPDQHLGRNTGIAMGYTHDDMRVWDPRHELGGLTGADCKEATFLLWKGHCSVHQRFRPEHIAAKLLDHLLDIRHVRNLEHFGPHGGSVGKSFAVPTQMFTHGTKTFESSHGLVLFGMVQHQRHALRQRHGSLPRFALVDSPLPDCFTGTLLVPEKPGHSECSPPNQGAMDMAFLHASHDVRQRHEIAVT